MLSSPRSSRSHPGPDNHPSARLPRPAGSTCSRPARRRRPADDTPAEPDPSPRLRTSSPSRTASSSTSTRAAIVFLTVERPYAASHWSIARSIKPAAIIDTGRCPSAGSTRLRSPPNWDPASTWDRCREPTDLPTGRHSRRVLTRVDTGSRGTLQSLDPGPRLFQRSVRTLHALAVVLHWMGPPNPRVVGRTSRTLTGLHVDGQAHPKRRHRLFSHDAMLARTLSAIHASTVPICAPGRFAREHRLALRPHCQG
jgi:hypothetical protein